MLFNSYPFILLFLPFTLLVYFLCNHFEKNNWSKIFLLAASLFFYGYFSPMYSFILIGSILVNYLFSIFQGKNCAAHTKKIMLILIIGINLGILFWFKYYNFFIENFNAVFRLELPLLKILMPLGISFFTFQQISYSVDCFKDRNIRYSFLEYALYVAFFPQLIAGPIVLHSEVIPQFHDKLKQKVNYENIYRGMILFAAGLGKKVLLADPLGGVANLVWGNVGTMGTLDALAGLLAYTFQIYFDFSGYCDMASGIARMFNIELPANFKYPYLAGSVTEFWKKWHITLTRFFTMYVYIPLGGSRRGLRVTCRNIMIIYLISGLWHGAAWTFVLWGLLHGAVMVIERIRGGGLRAHSYVSVP